MSKNMQKGQGCCLLVLYKHTLSQFKRFYKFLDGIHFVTFHNDTLGKISFGSIPLGKGLKLI
jgi:hypothetical protein